MKDEIITKKAETFEISLTRCSEKTGIFLDYVNEWFPCLTRSDKYIKQKKHERLYDCLVEQYPFKKYLERHHGYKITEKNKKYVKLLDKLVDEMNWMLEDESRFDCVRARTLSKRAIILIYGELKR